MKNSPVIICLTVLCVAQIYCMKNVPETRTKFRPIGKESEVIYRLKPQFFDYGSVEKIAGFDPVEVAKIDESLIIFGGDKKPSHVNFNTLEVFMLQEIQKHQKEINDLRKEIELLKNKK